jgi:hypothetical protein
MVAPHPNGHHGRPTATPRVERPEAAHQPATGPHPLEPLLAHVKELRRHAGHYLQASADSFRLTIRQALLRGALGLLGAVIGVTVLVTSTVLLLNGAAGGLAAAFGGRAWAGQLTLGATVLLMIGLACWWGLRKVTESSRRKTAEKYERGHYEEQAHVDSDAPRRQQHGQAV